VRILYVNNVLPYPTHDGGRMRRYHLARALAEEHEVSMLGVAPDPDALTEFERLNPRIRFLPIAYRPEAGRVRVAAEAREWLARETFDAVHVAELWQWPGVRPLAGLPVVLDAENVESLLHRRLLELKGITGSHPDLVAVEALERQAFQRADRILACSEHDALLIQQAQPDAQVAVVRNGVAVDHYPFRPERPSGKTAIFTYVGLLCYAPNADAASHFARSIWPQIRAELPTARFRIVGRYPPAEIMELGQIPGVEIIPNVPEIQPYFHEADVLVVPLRAGSGTRLKILEGLASGTPMISTTLGCEGLAVRHGEHLYIADQPAEFARQAVWMATHHDETRTVRDRGRRLVEERYGWETIGKDLRAAYAGLA